MSRVLRSVFPVVLCLALAGAAASQRRRASAPPRIDIEDYRIQVTLVPESHEFKATAGITFRALEQTDVVLLEMNENLSVQKIVDTRGIELEFGQDETGPGTLTVRFAKPLPTDASTLVSVEYSGGFDRDRFSRFYSRDESSAYIGVEGTYLLYSAKWFPMNGFLVDRARGRVEVSVPLGMVAVGPGKQLPVVTRGVTETFGWESERPILPNSIVASRYLPRRIDASGFAIECFMREDHVDAVQSQAEAIARILETYTKLFGPSASGSNLRIAEVPDQLALQPGTLGTIFLTHREMSQPPNIRKLARKVAYQWWSESVGVQGVEDVWLTDGMAYFSAALYSEATGGVSALKQEISQLAVLGLKFESKSAIKNGLSLGYRSDAFESVVAGKGAWVLLMLRQLVGPTKFQDVLRQYLKEGSAAAGSTAGLRAMAESAYGKELGWFFAQWIDTTGVPNLQTDYMIYKTRDGFRVAGTVKQDRDLFRTPLEIEVKTPSGPERATIEVSGKSSTFDVRTATMPQQVVLDPDSKLLRDSRELQIAVQMSLGDDLKEREQFVESIRAYENAIKLNARKSIAHFRLAEVFWEQSNLQSAANSFRDALTGDKDPPWVEVWCYIYLGKIYDILGQRQRAMAEYNKALNTKDETFGAQEEAKKYLSVAFTREKKDDKEKLAEKDRNPEAEKPALKDGTKPPEAPSEKAPETPKERPKLVKPPGAQ
jgi:tetratricopeptide (TPR) repeat protein